MKIPKIDQPKPLITIDLTADAINKKKHLLLLSVM